MRVLLTGVLLLGLAGSGPGASASSRQGGVASFRTAALADAGCTGSRIFSFPRGGVIARTVYDTTPGDRFEDSSETRYWSCFDGRRRSLGRGSSSFGEDSGLSGFRAQESILGYVRFSFSRANDQETVVVRDLRSSRVLGSLAGSVYDGSLELRALDPAGRALAVGKGGPPSAQTYELLTLTSAGRAEVLDPARVGEITAVALAPDGTATWRRAGEPRSARVP